MISLNTTLEIKPNVLLLCRISPAISYHLPSASLMRSSVASSIHMRTASLSMGAMHVYLENIELNVHMQP